MSIFTGIAGTAVIGFFVYVFFSELRYRKRLRDHPDFLAEQHKPLWHRWWVWLIVELLGGVAS